VPGTVNAVMMGHELYWRRRNARQNPGISCPRRILMMVNHTISGALVTISGKGTGSTLLVHCRREMKRGSMSCVFRTFTCGRGAVPVASLNPYGTPALGGPSVLHVASPDEPRLHQDTMISLWGRYQIALKFREQVTQCMRRDGRTLYQHTQ
jgi:hypothetical protein